MAVALVADANTSSGSYRTTVNGGRTAGNLSVDFCEKNNNENSIRMGKRMVSEGNASKLGLFG